MDEKLSFAEQTSIAALKAKRGIGALNQALRKWASTAVLKTAHTNIALPSLLYGIESWFPPDVGKQKQVAKVQKYAARLVTNSFLHSTTYDDLIQCTGWQPIHHLVAARRLLSAKKYLTGERHISAEVFELKAPNSTRCSGRLKHSTAPHDLQLVTRTVKNAKEGKLAAAQARMLWNALDEDAATCTVKDLKELLKDGNVLKLLSQKGVLVELVDV
jgi:hypothetical protein